MSPQRERERERTHLSKSLVGHEPSDFLRHLQTVWTDVPQRHVVQRQQPCQGVHCPTVLQVAHQSYLQGSPVVMVMHFRFHGNTDDESVDGADLLSDGEDVQQSLCWVLPHPIPCVDDGAVRYATRSLQR